jgi:hypothetical protein
MIKLKSVALADDGMREYILNGGWESMRRVITLKWRV